MDTFRRFTKNSISMLGAKVFSIIFSIAFGIYAARTLGDEGYGKYGFIIVLLSYFIVTSEFGLESLIVRDVAVQKEKSNDYLATSILFKLVTASISVLLTVGAILLLGRGDLVGVGFIAAFSLVPLSIYMSFDASFRAFERMEYIAIVEVVYMALRSGLGIFLLLKGYDLDILFTGFVVVECVRLILIMLFYHLKIAPLKLLFKRDLFGYFWKESIHLASWKMLGILYMKVEVLILLVFLGDAPVGWFKVSMNITDLISIMSVIALSAVMPVMSTFFLESGEKLQYLYRTVFRYIVIIMVPVATGITIFADDLINLMYGDQYANSVLILQILIWSAVISFILALLGTVIIVIDKFKLAAKLSLINTTFKIVLSIVLIKYMGYLGAPLSSLIANLVSLFLFIPVVSRTLGHTGIDFALIRSVLVALFIVAAGYVFHNLYGHLNIAIAVGFTIYLLVIFKTKMVTDREKELVRQIFHRGT